MPSLSFKHFYFPYLLVTLFILGGCAQKTFVLQDSYHQEIRSASRSLALQIAPELRKLGKPWQARQIVVGDFINEQTAELTNSGQDMHAMLLIDLREELPGMAVSELTPGVLSADAVAIQGITKYVPLKSSNDPSSWFSITITVTDLHEQKKVGETTIFVNARQFDPMPSRFYRDAPLYLTGSSHKARLVSAAGQGQKLLSVLQADARISDAISDYEKGNYSVAERKFTSFLNKEDHSNLVALSGRYQSLVKQGKLQEAEKTFGTLVSKTIEDNNLSVKFLFRVRSKEFWDDGNLAAQYDIWIRQVALQVNASGKCLEINGHASKSGSAEYNNDLSLRRARWVMEQMIKTEPGLASKLRANGKGFRENIIGSGSDNALDAIDRRVDFVFAPCN